MPDQRHMFINTKVTVMKAKGTFIHLGHHIATESKLIATESKLSFGFELRCRLTTS